MKEIVLSAKFIVGKDTSEESRKECSWFIYRRINKAKLLEYLKEHSEQVTGEEIKGERAAFKGNSGAVPSRAPSMKATFSPKSISKDDLIDKLLELPQPEIQSFACFFASELTLHPVDVQELLDCTTTERRRWTDEGKLRVLGYQDFDYGSYPVYDLVSTALISSETIEQWRLQHRERTKQHRRQGIQKAAQTRKENVTKRQIFQFQYDNAINQWKAAAPDAVDILRLAYWTLWCSRWAKTYQLKAKRARKYWEEYSDRSDYFYELKNKAIEILNVSPYARLGFYRPAFPDRYGEKDYYSLFYTELVVPGVDEIFSFHTPYPVGQDIFPFPNELPLVHHQEEEGLFRFGRPLEDEEFVTHTEKNVLNNFHDAIANFNDFAIAQQRVILWTEFRKQAEQRRIHKQQLKKMKISLPHGISLEDLVDEVIAKSPQLSVKNIAKEVRRKIREIAIYPDGVREFPDFQIYVPQVINRQFPYIKTLVEKRLS
ncbi:MAG: hypothetical protein AB4426_26490 [Xenococcaceae cyanobacterium]